MLRVRRQIVRLPCLSLRNYSATYSGGAIPDPKGLYEKGKAQENVYFRKKEYEDLAKLKKILKLVEQPSDLRHQSDKTGFARRIEGDQDESIKIQKKGKALISKGKDQNLKAEVSSAKYD